MTRLEKFKETCHKYFVIKDDEYIDVVVGTVFANRLDSKPVWLYLVGAPGGGKSEILQALSGSPTIYPLTQLTPHTLSSGMVTGEEKSDPSLLPKLDGKVVIIKDFTTLLSGRRETLMEVLGQLRDAYDGTTKKVFGTGKAKEYKAKFGLIAGVTSIIDKHQGILSALGERFLTCRLPEINAEEERQRCKSACKSTKVKQQEEELKKTAQDVLVLSGNIGQVIFPDNLYDEIIDIAMFVAKARSHVDRDSSTKEPEIVNPEIATRISKQLHDLAIGIACAREKPAVTEDEIKLVQKVALHCLTLKRIRTIKSILPHHPDACKTSVIAEEVGFSVSTVHRWLEDLELLGIVEKSHDGLNEPYSWKLRDADLLKKVLG